MGFNQDIYVTYLTYTFLASLIMCDRRLFNSHMYSYTYAHSFLPSFPSPPSMSVQGPLHRVREVGERRRALRGVGRPRPEPLGGDALLLAPPQ